MSKKLYPINNHMDKARKLYIGSTTVVNVCCYRILYANKQPILEYLLLKNFSNNLTFPQYHYDYIRETKTVRQLTTDYIKDVFSEEAKVKVESIGVKLYDNELYAFVEILGTSIIKEEKCYDDMFWFANMYDILNNKSLYFFDIERNVYMFFYKNKVFSKLTVDVVPQTFYKKINRSELPSFIVFDYIYTDSNRSMYTFAKNVYALDDASVLLKYLYYFDSGKENLNTVINTEDDPKKRYNVRKLETDALLLEKQAICLKTIDRKSLILYGYYAKNKTY